MPRLQVVRCELEPAEARDSLSLAEECACRYRGLDDRALAELAPVFAHELPRRAREAVNHARLTEDLHALVLAGHAVDENRLGPTPRHWLEADTDRSWLYAVLLMLYGSLFGDVFGWATQQDGRLITDVLPIAGLENDPISAGSHIELTWHTEDAFSPYRADHVGLLCLRNPDRTATTLTAPDLALLPEHVVEVLRQPRFHVLPDSSHTVEFSGTGTTGQSAAFEAVARMRTHPVPMAVLEGPACAPVMRVDRDFTIPIHGDDEAEVALKALFDLMDDSMQEVRLAPGDICVIDNRITAHGRRSFRPVYDGGDRWLKRVNTVRDLLRTRPGRVSATARVVGTSR